MAQMRLVLAAVFENCMFLTRTRARRVAGLLHILHFIGYGTNGSCKKPFPSKPITTTKIKNVLINTYLLRKLTT